MKKIHILLFLVLASIFSWQVYAAAPTATVSLSDTTLGIGETAIVTVIFSEQINENTFSINSPNGSIWAWSTSDRITFTNTFTPNSPIEDNTNTFDVDLGTVTDVATNTTGTWIASSANYIVDTIAPQFSSLILNNDNPAYLKAGESVNFELNISPADTSKVWNNLTFSIWSTTWLTLPAAFVTSDTPITTRNRTYTIQAGQNGTFSITSLVFFDAADNAITGFSAPYTPSAAVVVDTIAPVVSFADDASATPTQSDTINITVADTNANPSSYEYGFSADAVCDNSDTYGNTFTSGTNFVINTEAQNGNYICVRASDLAWNISYQASAQALNIDTTNPTLAVVTAVTSPTNDTTPNFTFSASEAGTITYGWACSSSTTAATSGNNTITLNTLAEGTYSNCTLTLTDSSWNTSSVLNIGTFIIDTTAPTITNIQGSTLITRRNRVVSLTPTCSDNVDANCTPTFSGSVINSTTGLIQTSNTWTFNADIRAIDAAWNIAIESVVITIRSSGTSSGWVVFTPNTTDICPTWDFSGNLFDGTCVADTEVSSSTEATIIVENNIRDEDTDATTESTDTTENENNVWENIEEGNMIDESSSSIFTDITWNWAQTYIETLAEQNVVAGNANGEFEPERAITRAEFLKMSLLAFGHSYTSLDAETMTFTDVDTDSWIANVVWKAQSLNIIDGVGNNNFRPNATITRAEAIKILLNTAGIESPEVEVSSFWDVEGWSTRYIEKAFELGIVSSNDAFRPNDAITRAESSKIIVQAMMWQ